MRGACKLANIRRQEFVASERVDILDQIIVKLLSTEMSLDGANQSSYASPASMSWDMGEHFAVNANLNQMDLVRCFESRSTTGTHHPENRVSNAFKKGNKCESTE
jgi:hypothetical protein